MNKNDIRKKYIQIRKEILNKEEKSLEIFNKIIKELDYIDSNVLALYYSLNSEVNTLKLIKYSLENNKTVLLPKIINNDMFFFKIDDLNHLVKSNFGVMEPNDGIIYNKSNIDLIVVPGVCFDKSLNRMGFGKGYYDKYLCDYDGKTIGICFEEQISNEIPHEKTDIKLQKIITDKNIYS